MTRFEEEDIQDFLDRAKSYLSSEGFICYERKIAYNQMQLHFYKRD